MPLNCQNHSRYSCRTSPPRVNGKADGDRPAAGRRNLLQLASLTNSNVTGKPLDAGPCWDHSLALRSQGDNFLITEDPSVDAKVVEGTSRDAPEVVHAPVSIIRGSCSGSGNGDVVTPGPTAATVAAERNLRSFSSIATPFMLKLPDRVERPTDGLTETGSQL
jgi:hypothetical protein